MKVAQVTERFHPYIGGVESHVLGLSSALRERGVDTVVVTRAGSSKNGAVSPHQSTIQGIPVFEVTGPLDLRRAVDRLNPDLLHLHGARARLTAEAGILLRFLGCPYVVTPHCFYPPRHLVDRLRKVVYDKTLLAGILQRARSVICLTDVDLRDSLQRGALQERTVTIPNAIDRKRNARRDDIDPPRDWDPAYRHVLSVGRLAPIKRFDWLIEAFLERAPKDYRLVIVGPDGGDEARLRRMLSAHGAGTRVHLAGCVSDGHLRWWYGHASLFVLASAFEGLPTVVLEAMEHGVPVLASDAGGTATLVKEGVNGFLFRGAEREDLATRLAELLTSGVPSRIVESARKDVESRFSWSVIGRDVHAVYSSSLSGNSQSLKGI